jgi:hypothetical protein
MPVGQEHGRTIPLTDFGMEVEIVLAILWLQVRIPLCNVSDGLSPNVFL